MPRVADGTSKWLSRFYIAGGIVTLLAWALAVYAVAIESEHAGTAITAFLSIGTTYLLGAGGRSLMERREAFLREARELDGLKSRVAHE